MIRQTVRGASCVNSLLRELGEGIEQHQVRIGDEKFHVGANVVAVADADTASGEVLIVVGGVCSLPSDPACREQAGDELACSGV
jgi:hypothetical protein